MNNNSFMSTYNRYSQDDQCGYHNISAVASNHGLCSSTYSQVTKLYVICQSKITKYEIYFEMYVLKLHMLMHFDIFTKYYWAKKIFWNCCKNMLSKIRSSLQRCHCLTEYIHNINSSKATCRLCYNNLFSILTHQTKLLYETSR